jgi:homocysteine S-methyltransferase
MNGRLTALIDKLGLVVDDGSMPTELEALGCDLNDALWSARVLMDEPELIKQVHREYFEAGADIGMSASYQATIPGFMKRGRTLEEAEALIKSSVTLLREARDEWWGVGRAGRVYPLTAAAVGPYGAYLADGSEYRGNYDLSDVELVKFHRRRMELLKEAGADCFAIETIPSLAEARVLAGLADELDLDCWVTFSCRNGSENCEGTPVRDCAHEMAKFRSVCAVGVNCTAPVYIERLIKEVRAVCDLPVIVYPNSGEEYDPQTKTWHGAKDGISHADYVKKWIAAGAKIIGGCCRTRPAEIREIYEIVKTMRS